MSIGNMIEVGMFASLGSIGYYTWLIYIIGIIALLIAYSYSKISIKFPTEGGVVGFFKLEFKKMYAKSFRNVISFNLYDRCWISI
ncbi:MAG: hypothetical protein R3Y52_03750 [Psittacicella sp.]